jgi:hypothetical protein
MVILLGLAAAVLYGSGDFLGGMATRKAHVLAVLTVADIAAAVPAVAAAAMFPDHASLGGSPPPHPKTARAPAPRSPAGNPTAPWLRLLDQPEFTPAAG